MLTQETLVYTFPFGSPLKKVAQKDKSPKKVFILGVYASAVHAKWIGADGRTIIRALAVASEPEIFWRGEDADKIISKINIPAELGRLVSAGEKYNGPSGKALDDLFLSPLGLKREDVWLSDLLPYCRLNPKQAIAIEKSYNPTALKYDLARCTIPAFRTSELNNQSRKDELIKEIQQSQCTTIITLGDAPIKYFLSNFIDKQSLSNFQSDDKAYGREHSVIINDHLYRVIPLVHPRQAKRLGSYSETWYKAHAKWLQERKKCRLE